MGTLAADSVIASNRAQLLDRLVQIAERMAQRIVAIEVRTRSGADLENRRGEVKWAVIQRLMQTHAGPAGKGLSYSQASSTEFLGADESYRDYLRHQDGNAASLARLRDEQHLDALTYRALIATLEAYHGTHV